MLLLFAQRWRIAAEPRPRIHAESHAKEEPGDSEEVAEEDRDVVLVGVCEVADAHPVDVMADEAAYDEMIQLSGQDLAPVIEVDGEILADFGPDQLAGFWKQLEQKNARLESR